MILADDACKLFLDEHGLTPCSDPAHRAALADRLEQAAPWDSIVRKKGRDFLAGRPIHCGERLELQGLTYRSDDFGEYSVRLETGSSVRYELAARLGPEDFPKIILFTSVGGHEFSSAAELWMRFRWPVQR